MVLTYEAAPFVDDCFACLSRMRSPGAEVEVIAVDNLSHDATVRLLKERHPWVTLVENHSNLGYAGGNNTGIRLALEHGAEFVYLLNPDTEVAPDFLEEALAVARAEPRAGAVQSLLLLASERDRVNSAGNAIHFVGLGYVTRYREPASTVPLAPAEIAFASGAAVLYRASALQEVGLLDEDLFLYHEDLDLGWRLRLAGFTALLAPRSIVFHKYDFSRNPSKLYFMERNRALVLLKNLRWWSLVVLAPALVAAEAGLAAVALRGGWFGQKVRAWGYLLRPKAWRQVRAGRRRQRGIRRVGDREIARIMSAEVVFDGLAGAWLTRVANPVMRLVWRALRPLIR